MTSKLSVAENIAMASGGGLVSTMAVYPLVRVKVLLQSQSELVKSGRAADLYKGATDCVRRTYRTEGFLKFWRGNLMYCVSRFPHLPLIFILKETMKTLFPIDKSDGVLVRLAKNVGSGALSGSVVVGVVYPLSFCSTRLAADVVKGGTKVGERQFSGIADVFRTTYRADGIVGLYRGLVVSCVGVAVYRGCYFGVYDFVKSFWKDPTSPQLFAVGSGVSITAGLISYPFDTIRVRMMMRSAELVKYKGSIDCATQIIRNEGFMFLMKGAVVSILRGFAGAGLLVGFDRGKECYIRTRTSRS